MRKWIGRQICQVSMLIIGVLILLIASLVSVWIDLSPIHVPVDLKQGNSNIVAFVPELSTRYLIEIEVQRNLPFQEVNCLLGIGAAFANDCRSTRSRIDLSWELRSPEADGVLARGHSLEETGGSWSDSISRTVGRFEAERGISYELYLTSNSAEVLPRVLKPHILVRADPLVSKSYFVAIILAQWFGAFLALIGIVFLAVSFRHGRAD